MGFESDFAELLVHTVTVTDLTGRDSYGSPTYGSTTTYKTRVVRTNTLVRVANGAEVVSSHHLWLPYIATLTVESKITLPDNTIPNILSVEQSSDELGDYYSKVFFQ